MSCTTHDVTRAPTTYLLKIVMVSSLGRILSPVFVAVFSALFATLIGKYNVPLPNPLKLLTTPAKSSSTFNNEFRLFVLASGMDPVVECVNQLCTVDVTHNLSN